MTRLCELAEKYGTNKAEYGYTPYYDVLVPKNAKHLLEIGIGAPGLSGGQSKHAASLKMWEEYLPEATIYGLDCRRELLINQGRIRSHYADVYDSATMVEAVVDMAFDPVQTGPIQFDVIIDDAVHEPIPQILAMRALLPYLSITGFYAIEDVANCDPLVITKSVPKSFYTYVRHCKLPLVLISRVPLSIP